MILDVQDHIQQQRRALGYLQQAICLADRDPDIRQFLDHQIHEVLVYARLKGHEIDDWSDNDIYHRL